MTPSDARIERTPPGSEGERHLKTDAETVEQKGIFMRLVSGATAPFRWALHGTWRVLTAPFRWAARNPIKSTLLLLAAGYFGAPYLFDAIGNIEGAAGSPALDWLQRWAKSMRRFTGGLGGDPADGAGAMGGAPTR